VRLVVSLLVYCGFWIAFRRSNILLLGCILLIFEGGWLAARCPGCHDMWGRWSCVMSRDVVITSVTMYVHEMLHGAVV